MIRQITHNNTLIAMILSADHSKPGLEFFTTPDLSLQVGYMKHPAGHKIKPHIHYPVPRTVTYTLEALFVKSGRIRVGFYSDAKEQIGSEILEKGDFILLVSGGHSFEFLEGGEMIEVKQGPHFLPDKDREKF